MDSSAAEEVYPLGRDAAETERLNNQHLLFLSYCNRTLIHPSIPENQIEAIADVATGTGIWLDDLSKHLSVIPTTTGNERSYAGFDISPQQFPPVKPKGTLFYVHDTLKPFPVEHHAKYDLVHLRFLLAVLREDQLKTAIENLVPLLKPGGYIQWDDLRHFFTYNRETTSELASTDKVVIDYLARYGISHKLPDIIPGMFVDSGLRSIVKDEYPPPDCRQKVDAARGIRLEFAAAMPPVFLRLGQAKDMAEAHSLAERNIRILESHFLKGWYPIIPFVSVVGQKLR